MHQKQMAPAQPATALASFDHLAGAVATTSRKQQQSPRPRPNRRLESERPVSLDVHTACPEHLQSKGRSPLGSRSSSRLSCLHSKDFVTVSFQRLHRIAWRLQHAAWTI